MITKKEIALVRSLGDKRGRAEHGLFVAEGEKLVAELLASDFEVARWFVRSDFAAQAAAWLAEANRRSPEASRRDGHGGGGPALPEPEVVSGPEMDRLSHLKTPAPVLALAEIPHCDLPDEPGEELSLALDGVQDPGNIGTIIRLADWFGIRDVYCSPDTADCFNPKVVQATMGAILRVRVHYTDLRRLLEHAAAHMTPVYGTFLDGENIYRADLAPVSSGIVVLGSEGRGISPAAAAAITRRLYIPPYPAGNPSSESLNVAAAAAIVCSEFRRSST